MYVFFAKFLYNDYIRPYLISHIVFRIFTSDLPVYKGSCYPHVSPLGLSQSSFGWSAYDKPFVNWSSILEWNKN